MQFTKNTSSACLVLGLALGAPAGLTQPAQPIQVDIAPCVGLASALERLDCYDSLGRAARQPEPAAVSESLPAPVPQPAATVTSSPAPAPDVAPTAVPAAAPQEPGVAEFGRNTPAEDARVLVNPEGEQELRDVIASLREREPGRWLITLASGQVWYQSNSQRLRLRVGNTVRIYPSPLGGSWRMARADGEQSGFIQVTRIE